ncbi:MAG: hypothetical protein K5660_09415 [Paludibacteraceae bacterium]|nr:hypothetical protein [Paludibacteraceae bacterium]
MLPLFTVAVLRFLTSGRGRYIVLPIALVLVRLHNITAAKVRQEWDICKEDGDFLSIGNRRKTKKKAAKGRDNKRRAEARRT